jgi:hypothetical protein
MIYVDSNPTTLTMYPFEHDMVLKNHTIVKELADLLQLYRKNVCFITDTKFFRPGCEVIQQMMDVNTMRADKAQDIMEKGNSPLTVNVIAENLVESSRYNEWWISNSFDDSLKQTVMNLVPDRHYTNHYVFVFSDIDVSAIFQALVKSGALENSVPNVMFLLGVQVQTRPFGMLQVKVLVGHVCDLLAKDLIQLNRL